MPSQRRFDLPHVKRDDLDGDALESQNNSSMNEWSDRLGRKRRRKAQNGERLPRRALASRSNEKPAEL